MEITQAVKLPDWTWYATGPGHGIQLVSGRLIIPCDYQVKVNLRADDPEYALVIYSDDGGAIWQMGGQLGPGCDESIAVQTADGGLYLNCRNKAEVGFRVFGRSTDGGLTFSPRQVESGAD